MNRKFVLANIVLAFFLAHQALAAAQKGGGEVQGELRDQQGDLVTGAKLLLRNIDGAMREAVSDPRGRFWFSRLAAGAYRLKVTADGFGEHEESLTLGNRPLRLTITLRPVIQEAVYIQDDPSQVALDPARAAGAQVLNEQQLKILPDDPDQLRAILELLGCVDISG